MKYGTPFGRANVMAAALAAVYGGVAQFGAMAKPPKTDDDPDQRVSSSANRRPRGAQMAAIRAARKARNIKRHRAQGRR